MTTNATTLETLSALQAENDNDETASASYIDIIETVISSLEQEGTAMVNHSEEGHTWKFQYGSVDVYVQLTGETAEDTLTTWSPVHKLPVQNEPEMMRKLLKMNCGNTFEACFGLIDQRVVVFASRTLQDINPSEISRLMTIVASIADENDGELVKNYPAA